MAKSKKHKVNHSLRKNPRTTRLITNINCQGLLDDSTTDDYSVVCVTMYAIAITQTHPKIVMQISVMLSPLLVTYSLATRYSL